SPGGNLGRGPSPKRRASPGRTDHDRRERPRPHETKPARPVDRGLKQGVAAPSWAKLPRGKPRQGPQPEKTCKSRKNRSRSARAATTSRDQTGEAGGSRPQTRRRRAELGQAPQGETSAGAPARKDMQVPEEQITI